MSYVQISIAFIVAHWATILGVMTGLSAIIATLITAFTNHPQVESVLHTIQGVLSFFEHADVGGLKMPFIARVKRPASPNSSIANVVKMAVVLFLLGSSQGYAQTFSAGLSVPLLEFQPGATHPVQFAPGVGVEASLGLFPETIVGMEADLLDISGVLFASAPGSMQAAITVGTMNDLICVGAAVPLYTNTGGGAFQGQGHVFPVLGGNVPFDLGKAPAPDATGASAGAKPRRFGTLYLGVL